MMPRMRAAIAALLLATTAVSTAACSHNSGRGAAIGAVSGAGFGLLGGGGVVRNAALGAGLGAAGGYLYDQLHHNH